MKSPPLALAAAALAATLACGGPAPGRANTPTAATTTPSAAERSSRTPQPCDSSDPLRRAFFGALHIHTALSVDAWSLQTRLLPDDAYAYASGRPVGLPPFDERGEPTRTVELERPLDFAAVTDHAGFLGETVLCTDTASPGYDVPRCRRYRGEQPSEYSASLPESMRRAAGVFEFVTLASQLPPERDAELCGEDGRRCRKAARAPWREIREAAARWNDTSGACRFTSFVAYEYTGMPGFSNLHRNVIFRGARVPAAPTSFFEAPTPEALWRALRRECTDAGTGCDAIAIPHNSNLANGRMFRPEYPAAATIAEQAALARERSALEPIAEIYQHKGDSECRNGFASILGEPDELCAFEKYRPLAGALDCGEGTGEGAIPFARGCVSRRDFVRYALTEGLAEADRIGANPFKLGIIAATDTHAGVGGNVDEWSYEGHGGSSEDAPAKRVGPNNTAFSPGGLAGVYAHENSREALFDAMRRRETFGTSGPRIRPRLFGGWEIGEDLCDASDFVARGYAVGVPMGGDLATRPVDATAPRFAVSAMADPGTAAHPGGLLARIQIIKGWTDENARLHQAVYDVAGRNDTAAGVDPRTCTPYGEGARELCTVWSDPDFDPNQRSYYYARVVENPSCRYDAWDCIRLGDARPPECNDPAIDRRVRERAWTSPIWYEPEQS